MFSTHLRIRGTRQLNHRDVYRFITEHWPRCQTRRCLLVGDEFSIVRGL